MRRSGLPAVKAPLAPLSLPHVARTSRYPVGVTRWALGGGFRQTFGGFGYGRAGGMPVRVLGLLLHRAFHFTQRRVRRRVLRRGGGWA